MAFRIAPEGYIPGWLLLGMEYTPELVRLSQLALCLQADRSP